MPLEQLLQQQKLTLPAAPAAPVTNSSPGRLTGQVNGRSGAEWPAVVTYGYWERHPRADLAMLAKSPQVDGHTHSVTPRNIGLISPDPVRDGYSAEPSVPFCQKSAGPSAEFSLDW